MRSQPVRLSVAACAICLWLFAMSLAAWAQGRQPGPAWPHTLEVNGVNVVVYQPQAIDWPNHETLTAREALAITLPGEKKTVLGTVEMSFATLTDAATGNVILSKPQLLADALRTHLGPAGVQTLLAMLAGEAAVVDARDALVAPVT